MRVQDIKTLIELQALQGLTDSSQNEQASASSMFQKLLADLMTDNSLSNEISSNGQTESLGQTRDLSLYLNSMQTTISNPLTGIYDNSVAFTGAAGEYEDIIRQAAEKYGIPEKLISAVIKQESNFDSSAVSHAGASGLMQLMPSTAKWLGVKNIFDPTENVMAGTKYLRQMLDQHDQNLELALAAYNAGPGNVKKYNGIPPFSETQNYVKKVMNNYNA